MIFEFCQCHVGRRRSNKQFISKVGGSNAYPDPAPKKVGGSGPRKTHGIYTPVYLIVIRLRFAGCRKCVFCVPPAGPVRRPAVDGWDILASHEQAPVGHTVVATSPRSAGLDLQRHALHLCTDNAQSLGLVWHRRPRWLRDRPAQQKLQMDYRRLCQPSLLRLRESQHIRVNGTRSCVVGDGRCGRKYQ